MFQFATNLRDRFLVKLDGQFRSCTSKNSFSFIKIIGIINFDLAFKININIIILKLDHQLDATYFIKASASFLQIDITHKFSAVIQPKLFHNKYYHTNKSKKENDNVSGSYHLKM